MLASATSVGLSFDESQILVEKQSDGKIFVGEPEDGGHGLSLSPAEWEEVLAAIGWLTRA